VKNSFLARALDIAFLVTALWASPESGKIMGRQATVPNNWYWSEVDALRWIREST
jgi:hypothetical protein